MSYVKGLKVRSFTVGASKMDACQQAAADAEILGQKTDRGSSDPMERCKVAKPQLLINV